MFTIDTGVLFPETYEVWRKVEERYGVKVEVVDATPPNGTPWSATNCCGRRKVAALERALDGADAWITGIRREQSPTRADAEPVEWDEARGIWKFNPLADWTEQRRVDATSTSTTCPTTRCTTGATSRSAARPAPCPATAARAAGPGRRRPSAGCTYDTAHMTLSPAPPILRRDEDMSYEISHLRALEAEAIHVIREVAAELERAVLLFSGGKDFVVLLRLAEKAFRPGALPFPVMHVDTGHNFPEVIEFRDRLVEELGARLIVASVQESIDSGRVVEETGPRASRNRLQTVTLLDAIEEHGFKAAFGGARRDEERARAKERILSFRDDFGQWDPKGQRPSCGTSTTAS